MPRYFVRPDTGKRVQIGSAAYNRLMLAHPDWLTSISNKKTAPSAHTRSQTSKQDDAKLAEARKALSDLIDDVIAEGHLDEQQQQTWQQQRLQLDAISNGEKLHTMSLELGDILKDSLDTSADPVLSTAAAGATPTPAAVADDWRDQVIQQLREEITHKDEVVDELKQQLAEQHTLIQELQSELGVQPSRKKFLGIF